MASRWEVLFVIDLSHGASYNDRLASYLDMTYNATWFAFMPRPDKVRTQPSVSLSRYQSYSMDDVRLRVLPRWESTTSYFVRVNGSPYERE